MRSKTQNPNYIHYDTMVLIELKYANIAHETLSIKYILLIIFKHPALLCKIAYTITHISLSILL